MLSYIIPLLFGTHHFVSTALAADPNPIHDLFIYGKSAGAVTSATHAKREGRSVIWLNPTKFAGGMTVSGLGATDFLGKPGTPRGWINIQDGNNLKVRNHNYMLNNKGALRPVVELWEPNPKLIAESRHAALESARKSLQRAFYDLGK